MLQELEQTQKDNGELKAKVVELDQLRIELDSRVSELEQVKTELGSKVTELEQVKQESCNYEKHIEELNSSNTLAVEDSLKVIDNLKEELHSLNESHNQTLEEVQLNTSSQIDETSKTIEEKENQVKEWERKFTQLKEKAQTRIGESESFTIIWKKYYCDIINA